MSNSLTQEPLFGASVVMYVVSVRLLNPLSRASNFKKEILTMAG